MIHIVTLAQHEEYVIVLASLKKQLIQCISVL
jgi:hypothetical protein